MNAHKECGYIGSAYDAEFELPLSHAEVIMPSPDYAGVGVGTPRMRARADGPDAH